MNQTAHPAEDRFIPVNIAVMTVSDTRTEETDKSGNLLTNRIRESGHNVADKVIVNDDKYAIRATLSQWIADKDVNAVICTGGTGLTGRDVTPEAIAPLFDKPIEGFGELFRHLSFRDISTSTLQSRAIGGIANATYIFCLPGSSGACITAWDEILVHQFDVRHKPCNFIQILPRLKEV